jgi:hypothetical protein
METGSFCLKTFKTMYHISQKIKFVLFFAFFTLFFSSNNYAQTDEKAWTIRQKMMEAYGGEAFLSQIDSLDYILETKDFATPRPTIEIQHIKLNFQEKTAEKDVFFEKDTIRYFFSQQESWVVKSSKKSTISASEKQKLVELLQHNPIYILQNKDIQFTYLKSEKYEDTKVDIVRIAFQNGELVDYFISKETSLILAYTIPNLQNKNLHQSITHLSQYDEVYQKLPFPLNYQITISGKRLFEGKLKNIFVNGE